MGYDPHPRAATVAYIGEQLVPVAFDCGWCGCELVSAMQRHRGYCSAECEDEDERHQQRVQREQDAHDQAVLRESR